jgi:RNA polymerase sigma factor (sigma-70 family)
VATATPAQSEARLASAEALAEQLYATHRTRLLAIARRNSASAEDAEEALQDAFILFIDHFDPDEEAPPLAWLTLTLKRRCWALYQRQRRVRARSRGRDGAIPLGSLSELVVDTHRLPDELAEVAEGIAKMRSQLAQLKPQERKALGLLALGYSYREIGQLTGWTYTKVNRCISEGRAALRKLADQNREADRL